MATPDDQLVQQVVKQVLEALQRRDAERAGDAPAGIRPPVGVCTGDYSQFTDRPDLAGGAASSHSPGGGDRRDHGAATPAAASASGVHADLPGPEGPPPLTGIVTAEQLREAAAASPDGAARLDAKARLTPLANDLVRESPGLVIRAGATSGAGGAGGAGAADALPWLWWAAGHCPAVQSLTQQRRGRLRPSGASRDHAGLSRVVRDVADGVAGRKLRGGLLFVSSAARALLLANRCPSLRAVSAHRPDTLDDAIADLAPNVIVFEYPRLSKEAMGVLLDKALHSEAKPSPTLMRELRDLGHA